MDQEGLVFIHPASVDADVVLEVIFCGCDVYPLVL